MQTADSSFISPKAKIGKNATIRKPVQIYDDVVIGDNLRTGHYILIRSGSRIGDNVLIGTHAVVDGNVIIGNNCSLQTGVYLPPGTIVGDNVFMGPYVTVTNDRYPPSPAVSGVSIGKNCVIGSRAVLVAGVHIGDDAVVGAGAVVTKDVPSGKVVLGIPARVVGTRKEYEMKKREFCAKSGEHQK